MIRDLLFDNSQTWDIIYRITNNLPVTFEINTSNLSKHSDEITVGIGVHTWGFIIRNRVSGKVLTLPKEVINMMTKKGLRPISNDVGEVRVDDMRTLTPSTFKSIDDFLGTEYISSPINIYSVSKVFHNSQGRDIGYEISLNRRVKSLYAYKTIISFEEFVTMESLNIITKPDMFAPPDVVVVADDYFTRMVINNKHEKTTPSDTINFIKGLTALVKKKSTPDLVVEELTVEEAIVIEKRPTWQEYFMASAELMSSRSTCDRLFVGAVLVQDNHIVAEGYNGSIAGHEHCEDDNHLMYENGCKRTIHAEMNIITTCAKLGIPTKDGTIYVTHQPCPDCVKHLNQAGIKEIIYKHPYTHRYENNFDRGIVIRQYTGRNVNISWD